MINSLKKTISRNLINIPGFRTDRKIVVFESDDWGSIRIPNQAAIGYLKALGVKVEKCHYTLNDTLENESDLANLFEVLTKYKDFKGNHPKITANTIVCNPDFERIENSNFEHYFWELNTSTYKKYFGNSNVEMLIDEGIRRGIYRPQLHGREHVNLSRWMKLLRANDEITKRAFELNLFAISGNTFIERRPSLMAVFDGTKDEIEFSHRDIVSDAVKCFEELYNYKTATFIAPNYVWDQNIENFLFEHNIKYLQGAPTQVLPSSTGSPRKYQKNYLGKKNKNGQKYLIRNVNFEPASNLTQDWVSTTLSEISTSFTWKKPAIINTHRVNFVSGLNKKNSSNTLILFTKLLSEIKAKWPNVEFMSSDELIEMI